MVKWSKTRWGKQITFWILFSANLLWIEILFPNKMDPSWSHPYQAADRFQNFWLRRHVSISSGSSFYFDFIVQDVPRFKKQRNYHPKLETLKGRYSSTVQVAFKSCPEKPWLRPFKSYKQFPSWETCAQYLWERKMLKGKEIAEIGLIDTIHWFLGGASLSCPMRKLDRNQVKRKWWIAFHLLL